MKYVFFESLYLRIFKDWLSELLKQLQEHLPVLFYALKSFKLFMLTSWEVLWNVGGGQLERKDMWQQFLSIFLQSFFPLKELC